MLLTLVTMWVAILMSLLFCADSLNSAFVAYLSIFMAPELLPTQEQAHDYVQLVGYTVLIYYSLLPRRLVVVAWKKFFTVEHHLYRLPQLKPSRKEPLVATL